MMGRDLVRPDPDRHGALRMTEAARPVLRGEATVTLRRDTVVAAGERAGGPGAGGGGGCWGCWRF
jgi:ATP-dependent DNA helicase RecQ